MAGQNLPGQKLEEIFKWPSSEALNINFDCNNADCPFSAPTKDLHADHGRKCGYRTIGCPFPDSCSDKVIPVNGIIEHLGTSPDHLGTGPGYLGASPQHLGTSQSAVESMSAAGTCSIDWDPSHFKGEPFISYGYEVRKHMGDHFILYVAVVNDDLRAWVTVIGDAEVASKYSAVITMGKDDLKTTICRGRVHSIDEVKDTVEEENDEEGVILSKTEGARQITLDYQIKETAEVDDFILM